jgi:hypothetical protein
MDDSNGKSDGALSHQSQSSPEEPALGVDVEKLAERVYMLITEALRLEKARGVHVFSSRRD